MLAPVAAIYIDNFWNIPKISSGDDWNLNLNNIYRFTLKSELEVIGNKRYIYLALFILVT